MWGPGDVGTDKPKPSVCEANWPKTVNASRGQEEKRDLSLYSDTYAAILYK